MSIRKRGKAWEIVIELGKDADGNRKQKTFTFHGKKEDAREEERRLKYELKHGYYIGQGNLTVGKFLDEYLKYGTQDLSYNTLKSYTAEINNHIKPYLGDIPLTDLTPFHLVEYYQHKLDEGKLSTSTINYHHRILKVAFGQPIPVRLKDNPCDSVTPPSKKKFRPVLLTADQITMVLNHMKDDPRYISVLLSIMTGMRRGETCGLHWDEVDFDKKLIKVDYSAKRKKGVGVVIEDTKTGKGRYIPISPFLESELKKQKEKQAQWAEVYGKGFNPLNLVVCWQDGRPIDPNEVTKQYNRVLKSLNMPSETRFHDLRHAHATMLYEDGAESKDVSEELGHSSIVITNDIYINPNIDRRRDLVNKLDKKFAPEKEVIRAKKYKVKRVLKP